MLMDIHYWKKIILHFNHQVCLLLPVGKGYFQFHKILKFTCYIKDERSMSTGSQFIFFFFLLELHVAHVIPIIGSVGQSAVLQARALSSTLDWYVMVEEILPECKEEESPLLHSIECSYSRSDSANIGFISCILVTLATRAFLFRWGVHTDEVFNAGRDPSQCMASILST